MITPEKKLEDKRILIVDDQAEMRALLKKMAQEQLGIEKIDVAMDAEEALGNIKANLYDIIFCDYELGLGKDGQQILEEVRHFKLISFNAAFILVTAATTRDMVMGALEYCPDGYLTKPINSHEFKVRILKVLKAKSHFKEIGHSIDENNTEEALKSCNNLITQKPQQAFEAFRIKGKLLLSIGRFEEAQEVYEFVLGLREQPWARLGLAKTYFYAKKYDEAKELLDQLILEDIYKSRMECYDWLSKVYEKKGDLEKAEQKLLDAVQFSPKAILRQTELGRIALKNKHLDVAAKALRKAVSLGRNSCFRLPDNYLNLAKSVQDKVQKGGHRDKSLATGEALKALKDVRAQFPDEVKIQVRSFLGEAETYKNLGNFPLAKKAIESAAGVFKSVATDQVSELIKEIGETLAKYAEQEEVSAFLNEIKAAGAATTEQLQQIEESASKVAEQKSKEKVDNFNNKGVECFEKGQIKEAIAMFEQALSEEKAGYGILLNALQAYVIALQKFGIDDDLDKRCQACFARGADIPKEDPRFNRYQKLTEMYEKIKK